ncbi:MAG: hypothetical protein L3J11_04655 [Draconibacterium sp.]|nr:hypothetical protein [Draconibacterium sp.]
MKKLGFLLMVIFLGTTVSMAQNRSWQNSTPKESAKKSTETLKEKLGLKADQEKQVYALNLKSAKEMVEMRKGMGMGMQGGGGDRDAMRAKFTKMREDTSKAMKQILSKDQYVKYEKYLEERRASRGQRGGRNR